MVKNLKMIALCLSILGSLSSCTTVSYMQMAGTRNIDYSATYEKGSMTKASGEITMLFVIPLEFDDLYPMEIIDSALEKGGYDFMTDIEVKRTFVITYLINYGYYEVSGYGWKKIQQ